MYLVTFYDENSSKVSILERKTMNVNDVLLMYERMLNNARFGDKIDYPSRLFKVHKMSIVTDNSAL